MIRLQKKRSCAYFGDKAYHACDICKENRKEVALHVQRKKGEGFMDIYFFHYHNDNHIVLAQNDQVMYRKRKRSYWQVPTGRERGYNKEAIKTLKDRFR